MKWPLVKISDFCQTGSGGTPSREVLEFYQGDIPWIKSGDLRENVVTSATEFISDEAIQKSSAKIVPCGAILVAMYGATVGRMALLGIDAATNQAVCNVVPDPSKAVTKYVYYALLSKVPDFLRSAIGGAQPNISQGLIRATEIPLPPLPEQKRITAILDKADAIRRKRKHAIQLADDFLRAVFLDMFGDPATNPKGFKIRRLMEFYVDGKTGTKCGPFGSALKKEEYTNSGIPVWGMDNITLSGEFIDTPSQWVSEEKYRDLKSYSLRPGDVIISRAGTVGKMGVVRSASEYSLISTNLIRVRFGDLLLPEYFVSLMTYCKGRVGRLKVGPDGAFTHMNVGVLDNLELPYPPIQLQKKYLDIKRKVIEVLGKEGKSHKNLGYTFDSLSHKEFSGEL